MAVRSYDAEVGIVGAGPAGARAAERLAAGGVDVLVWDPKAPWEKPCGGGLTAALTDAVPEIAEVLPRAHPVDRVRIKTDQDALPVVLALRRPIHVIARRTLGAWQLDRARAAGARITSAAIGAVVRDTSSGWSLVSRDSGARASRVRFLIGADGAASTVRAAAAPGLKVALEPTRLAYVESAGAQHEMVLRFEQGIDGYAWDFPRPGHRSIGAVAAPGTTGGTRARLDSAVKALAAPHESIAVRHGAVVGSALYPMRRGYPEIGGADFALLGDAAGLADPATGEGIANAMRSADLAAETFLHERSFRKYGALVAARLGAELREARWLRHLLYQRGYAVRLVAGARGRPSFLRISEVLINGANEHWSFARQVLDALLAAVRGERRFGPTPSPGGNTT
jgi:flavin-dependent dehydrogenase